MTGNDPYKTPESDLSIELEDELDLASRGARLGGALLDALFTGVPAVAIAYFLGLYDNLAEDGTLPLNAAIMALLIGIGVFLAININLIYKHGQTLGKYIVGTRVVTLDGRQVPGNTYIFYRLVPIWVLTQIPLAGGIIGLVNALLIFRKDRNCLHDDIAKTRVVKA